MQLLIIKYFNFQPKNIKFNQKAYKYYTGKHKHIYKTTITSNSNKDLPFQNVAFIIQCCLNYSNDNIAA